MSFPAKALALGCIAAALAGYGATQIGSARTPRSVSRQHGGALAAAVSGAPAAPRQHAHRGAARTQAQRAAGRQHPPANEAADPQEGASFPAPATVHHVAAAAPAKAGEAVVASGAPSDAEVRAELRHVQAVQRSASQSQQLTAVPGGRSVGGNGAVAIPANVPEVLQRVIAGANEIADFPYVFGGGHASFVDNAYDCSGSVSYALAAGGLLGAPETSGELESWGVPGPGRYITVYANAGHTYMYVDGMLYDTAGRSGVFASRWQVGSVDNTGFVARHWPGL